MNKVRLMALLIGIGAGLVWNPSGLFAQQEPPESAVETGQPAGSGRGTTVEELPQLFVTGERVTRSVKETPSSVYVVTDDDLRNLAGPDRVDTILSLTPNVQLNNANNNGPAIRGQNSTGILSGAGSFLGGARPRTTIMVDGRPLSYNEFLFGLTSAWDIERVEVFRGPQTTTQGRNSIAGAVFVQTKDPTYEYEAAVRGLGGNFDTYQGSAMVSGPLLADQLAFRATVDYRDTDTFLKFAFPDEKTGVNRKEDGYLSTRGKLLFEPTALPNLSAKLTYAYTDVLGPQTENVGRPFVSRRRLFPQFSSMRTETHSLIADVTYAFDYGFSLSNRFTYADVLFRRYAPPGTGVARLESDEFTNETLLTFDREDIPISAIAGVYSVFTNNDEMIDLAGFRLGKDNRFSDDKTSVGVFGEATWSITARLHLTGGLRYQRDNQDRFGTLAAGAFRVDYDETFDEVLPKASLAYDLTEDIRVGVQVSRGFNPGGTTLSFFTGQVDEFDEERLWNYEMFLRSFWLDQRLRLNANVFVADFDDAQRANNIPVQGQVVTELDNADDALAYGAEIEAMYWPVEAVSVFVGLGLLDTEIRRNKQNPAMEGNEFERAPSLSFSFGLTAEPWPNLVFSTQGRFTDDYYSDDDNTPELAMDSYFFADAQLSYTWRPAHLPDTAVRLFVFATNLFNNFYGLQSYGDFASVSSPREYGVGLELRY